MFWVALHFPGLAAGMLEPLAAWACQFTPRVALEPPDTLLIEVEGSLRYFGGRDALWAAEQALRAGSCHALLAWLRNARYQELRRLAVAAEASHAFVALFRPREAARESSPACLRIALEPAAAALEARILKRRGAPAAAPLAVALKRPFHALGRTAFSRPSGQPRADRRLGLPVHA